MSLKHIKNKMPVPSTSTLTETVNKEACDKLAFISFKDYQDVMKRATTVPHKAEKYTTQWKLVQTYCRTMRENDYRLEVPYKIAGGRIVAEGCALQRINKLVRGALCHGRYIDYDMVNCHPVLLVHICKTRNIPCRHLERYMSNREEHLKALMDDLDCTRDDAKFLFLSSANYDQTRTTFTAPEGGRPRKIKCKTFIAFDEAMKEIQQTLVPMCRDEIKGKYKPKDRNEIGSAMSYIMCDLESKVLTEALAAVKVVPNVRMFDGFMLDADTELSVAALDRATEKYGIRWSVKEHDTSIVESLAEVQCSSGDSVSLVCPDLLKMCNDLLATLFKGRLCRNQGTLYFKTKGGWVSEANKAIERGLFRELSDCDLWLGAEDTATPQCVSASNHHLKNLIEFVTNRAVDDPRFLDHMYEWTKGKVYFQNGYWDFPQNRFVETADMHTFVVVPRDFSERRDPALRRDLFRRVFDPIFTADPGRTKPQTGVTHETQTALRDRFLHKWARIMAGHVEDKDWLVLTGPRNCGKGVIIDLTIGTFAKYVGSTNAENFAVKRTNGDSQKALSFLIPFQWKRAMVASEMELSRRGEGLSGTLIKKVNSGGDTLSARSNFRDEIEFHIQATLALVCNDMDEVKPVDTMEKCEMYPMKSKFVQQGESKEFQNLCYYEADPSVKDVFIKDSKVQNEFVHVLIDAYNHPCRFPSEIKLDAHQFTDDLSTLIKRHFVVGPKAVDGSGEPCVMTLSEFKKECEGLIKGYSAKKLHDACVGLGAVKPTSPFQGANWSTKQRGLKYIRRRCGEGAEIE